MSLSFARVATIARREYLATVRRKGFVFTIVGMPLMYAGLFFILIRPQLGEQIDTVRKFKVLGVVDSSGAFANAPHQTQTDVTFENPFSAADQPERHEMFTTEVRFYPGFPAAEKALRSGDVHQVLVVPADYLATGKLRRYASRSNLFSSMDERVVSRWLVRSLISGKADSARVERVARPLGRANLFALGRDNRFELKDDRREMLDFLFPLAFGLLLGLCIMIGGQYLLQGVTEEKESRILESMLSTVSPDELLTGKLIGLGGAGLTLAAAWILMGALSTGPAAMFLHANVRPEMLITMLAYFLCGYLFFGSIMIGIGSIASTMREAQQFSVWLVFASFIPFYLLTTLVGHPDSPLALALSLFPVTAPVSTMLRIAAPGSAVPAWQIVASLTLLLASAALVMFASSRVFRVGMLMYGKTPNLPEIVRWIRRG